MQPTRGFNRIVFPLSAALLFCALINAQSPDPPLQGKATLVYIGTGGNKGKGIHLFRLQSAGTEVSQNVTLVPFGFFGPSLRITPMSIYRRDHRIGCRETRNGSGFGAGTTD